MRIVDLFSGAGGLTFGFYYNLVNGHFEENFANQFIFANEFNTNAAKAFEKNFPNINMICDDVTNMKEDEIKELIGADEIDLIVGGPPCQSFSTVGKRVYDDKAKMYEEYLRLLKIIKPKMFLFENVKGILSMKETFYQTDEQGNLVYEKIVSKRNGKEYIRLKPIIIGHGKKIMDKIKEQFAQIEDTLGYEIKHEVINAVDFGVPQNRERVFIIGIRKDLNVKHNFPQGKKDALTIFDAISDLPTVKEGEVKTAYNVAPQNDYQRLMRENNEKISSHFCGVYGDKIRTVIQNVLQGQGKNDFNKLIECGDIDKKYELTSGYANTYGRLIQSLPCTTITNNMTTPSGLRCIHYDQHRALTPREGARLQSFPDWFQFEGSKADVTTQIGNAVPPLLAMAMAREIEKTLEDSNE